MAQKDFSKSYFQIIPIAVIISISIGIYANSLQNTFVYDDEETVVENQIIKSWGNLYILFNPDYFEKSGELSYRPVVTFTYFIDYFFWKLNPKGYHLSNVMLHALTSVLLYIFVRLIGQKFKWDNPEYTALFAGILFCVHPVLSETVNAVSFREDILAALFLVLSLILFVKSDLVSLSAKSVGVAFYIGSLASFFFALLSKEMAITMPLLLFLLDISTINKGKNENLKYYNFRSNVITFFAKRYSGFIIVCCIYFLIRFSLLYNPDENINYADYSILTNFLTMTKVVAIYVKLFFFPLVLNADYVVRFSSSPLDSAFLISFFILTSLIIILVKIYKIKNDVFFAAAWILITLFPVLNIIPIANIMAERYLYIPSMGFFIGLSILLQDGFKGKNIRHGSDNLRLSEKTVTGYWKWFVFIAIVISCSFLTIRRNTVWKDDLSLWSETIAQSPVSPKAHYNLGREYFETEDSQKAIELYQMAIRLSVNYYRAYNNLGIAYEKEGAFDDAIEAYNRALEIKPGYDKAHNNLGIVYYKKGDIDHAIDEYKKAIELNDKFGPAWFNLGNAYAKIGLFEKAEAMYRTSINCKPNSYLPYHNLGVLYFKNGMWDEAILAYKNALEKNNESSTVHYNLGNVYKKKGLYEPAIAEYKWAIELDSSNINARNMLGVVYVSSGHLDEAVFQFKKALKFENNNSKTHSNLANVYYIQGLISEAENEYKIAMKLDKGNINAYKNLSKLYINENKENGKALFYLNEALQNAIDQGEIDGLKEMIDELEE